MLENSKRFTKGQKIAHDRYGTAQKAKLLVDNPGYSCDNLRLWPGFKEFIESRSFFFLASADSEGRCQCNYRGGEPGFVIVQDDTHLYFPDYDGNGILHTLGNFIENPHVGLLFIDFDTGVRVKTSGKVTILDDPDMIRRFRPHAGYQNALRIISVQIEYAVPNCSQYLDRVRLSF